MLPPFELPFALFLGDTLLAVCELDGPPLLVVAALMPDCTRGSVSCIITYNMTIHTLVHFQQLTRL